jgi:hypothetical protein
MPVNLKSWIIRFMIEKCCTDCQRTAWENTRYQIDGIVLPDECETEAYNGV